MLHFLRAFGYQIVFIADSEATPSPSERTLLDEMGVICATPPEYPDSRAFLQKHGNLLDVCLLCRVYSGGRAQRRASFSSRSIYITSEMVGSRD
jgi:hypothetical protein